MPALCRSALLIINGFYEPCIIIYPSIRLGIRIIMVLRTILNLSRLHSRSVSSFTFGVLSRLKITADAKKIK